MGHPISLQRLYVLRLIELRHTTCRSAGGYNDKPGYVPQVVGKLHDFFSYFL